MMTIGSLFSGIGGLELGLELAGLGPVIWQVEQDERCRRVLAKHWPDARRFEDVREIGQQQLEDVGIICGGFPCQPASVAGPRRGNADNRWLWPEFARLIRELRPPISVLENVPGLLSINGGRLFGEVLGELAASGYDATWNRVSAAAVGAPHERDRVFVVATDTNRGRLRLEQRGRCRADWGAALQSVLHGQAQPVAYSYEHGRNEGGLSFRAQAEEPQLASGCGDGRQGPLEWFSTEPRMGRVVDGPTSRLDEHIRRRRLAALGNAVVPACAQVVGEVIKQILM
jgi:DNA (cytosine-5)-methyltransferase 1